LSTWADLAAAHLAVTIEDVARHAEIGKGTVYLHWKTREALFGAVFEREVLAAIEELIAGLREDPEAWLPHRLARSYFPAIVGRPLLRGLFLDDAQLLGKLARPGGGGRETRHRAISHDYFDLMTEHGVVHRPGGREAGKIMAEEPKRDAVRTLSNIGAKG
jgi:AcrR family transcriptional regulator